MRRQGHDVTWPHRWLFAILLAASALVSVTAFAQEAALTAEESTATDEGLGGDDEGLGGDDEGLGGDDEGLGGDDEDSASLGLDSKTDLDAIEDLLAQDESTRSNTDAFAYDAGTRRDPFRSLLQARNSRIEETRERPEGKAGLLIDEIVIEGMFQLADGPVVQVQSAHQDKSFLLRPGDQLWDGDVIDITLEEVVFKQLVDDPTALKPFREVVKRLNP